MVLKPKSRPSAAEFRVQDDLQRPRARRWSVERIIDVPEGDEVPLETYEQPTNDGDRNAARMADTEAPVRGRRDSSE